MGAAVGRPPRSPLRDCVGRPLAVFLGMMTEIEQSLLNALLALERAVAEMATAHPKPNLLPLFEQIDDLTGRLPSQTEPALLHYLHKRSYEKARLYLQGRDAENQAGKCRHV